MAGVSIPLLSPSRCVLLITDDSLCIYKTSGSGVDLLESVPWRTHDFGSYVAGIIRAVGGGSVMILNDAVEQHYRKEKVPKIAMLDRANMIERRVNVAFPSYPIRAALELKDKSKKSLSLLPAKGGQGQADGSLYLFAAVPASDAFARVMDAVTRAGVAVSSYSLLPVESADMVKKLADLLSKQKRVKNTATWSVLIGQHHGGGLRQIVTKNGELALTRITPVRLPEDGDASSWCGDVAQEFQATLSYLSRFGYNPDDGLNVIAIGNPDLGNQLESFINLAGNYFTLTASQAGQMLGLRLGRKLDSHYADPLHAAWVARKPSPILPFRAREIERISRPRKIAHAATILLTIGVGAVGFVASNEAQAIYAANKNMEVAIEEKAEIERLYQEELKRKESMGIDVKLIQSSIAIYQRILDSKVDPLPLLQTVGEQLKNLRLDGVSYLNPSIPDAPPDPNAPMATEVPTRDFSMTLRFSFAGTVKPQDGNKEIREFTERLGAALPDYDVSVKKELVDLSYTGALVDETGLTAQPRKADDRYQAEVLIKKAQKSDAQNTGN